MQEKRKIGHLYKWNQEILLDLHKDKNSPTYFMDIFFIKHSQSTSLNKLISIAKNKEVIITYYKKQVELNYNPTDIKLSIFEKFFSQIASQLNTISDILDKPSESTKHRYTNVLNSKKEYYKITVSHDPDSMGVEFPQINDFKDKANLDKEHYRKYMRIYNDSIKDLLDFDNFLMQDAATEVDFISTRFLALNGFFITKKCKDILTPFTSKEDHFIKSTVYAGQEKKEIYFLHFTTNAIINYNESTFSLKKAPYVKNKKAITFKNNVERNLVGQALINEGSDLRIESESIVLSNQADFFKMPYTADFIASDDLIAVLKEKEIKGFEYKKTSYNIM